MGITARFRFRNFGGKARDAIRKAGAEALGSGAHVLLEGANRTVPIEEGTLMRSGQVSVDAGQLKAAVSYDTPYAVRQHEDTRASHDAGRRAKWLEQEMLERGDVIMGHIADDMKRRLR